jgi:membrane-bound lytic murein transglycosylase A
MARLHHCLFLLCSGAALATPPNSLARWTPAAWAELPGWGADAVQELWPALRQQCARPPAPWRHWCTQLPAEASDPLQAHAWLMATLQPYRVEAKTGAAEGLLTGYFEPQLEARRRADESFATALLDAQRRPLLYLQDPIDAVLLQVQGSGRVWLREPDGRQHWRRVAWAGDNRQPFGSLGRWLVAQGAIREGQASWSAIRAWALKNPERLPELLAANPRVIYFREEALPDPGIGPRGAQGLPLTPGRSVAVDPRAVPHGSLLWLDSPGLSRLVLAQDSGAAIQGAVRADFFWGWAPEAFGQAARTHQPLRWWALLPKPETSR